MKSIHPFVGYALKDNVVVGAKFGYSHIVGDLGNIDLNLGDDLSFNIGNMRYTEDMYSFGVLIALMWDWMKMEYSDCLMKQL